MNKRMNWFIFKIEKSVCFINYEHYLHRFFSMRNQFKTRLLKTAANCIIYATKMRDVLTIHLVRRLIRSDTHLNASNASGCKWHDNERLRLRDKNVARIFSDYITDHIWAWPWSNGFSISIRRNVLAFRSEETFCALWSCWNIAFDKNLNFMLNFFMILY